ncbi:MAG: hypothetical protein U0X20_09460 [Caldilineaceae bacterium]
MGKSQVKVVDHRQEALDPHMARNASVSLAQLGFWRQAAVLELSCHTLRLVKQHIRQKTLVGWCRFKLGDRARNRYPAWLAP